MSTPSSDINFNHPLLRFLPKTVLPYAMLIRLDRPIGTYLGFLPALMALNLAFGRLVEPCIDAYAGFFGIFFLGAFLMRSAGCIWNDIIDRRLDRQVERTRNRPLASGDVSVFRATLFMGICLFLAFGLLLLLPTDVLWVGVGIIPCVLAYPLMKRFFPYPQLWLGITFTSGVWIAWLSIQGLVTLLYPSLLFLGCVFWTVGYDTIYALQDIKDDQKQGVYSMPISLGRFVIQGIVISYLLVAVLWGALIILTKEVSILPFAVRWALYLLAWGYLLFQLKEKYSYKNERDNGVFDRVKSNFLLFFEICRKKPLERKRIEEGQGISKAHGEFFRHNAAFGLIISGCFF